MNVHIGCAYTVGKNWKNYDCTPTSRVQKIPIIGKFININQRRFPKEVIYGDIVKSLLSDPEQAENRVKKYQNDKNAHEFIGLLGMGKQNEDITIIDKLRNIFGNSTHRWMYDEQSMLEELKKANFINIRKCQFGDSNIPVFSEVEDENSFYFNDGDSEVAFQCSK